MEETVGERMRRIRKEKKISVDTIANKIGINRATLYRYENGDIDGVPYLNIIPIADALGVSPTYLMGFDDELLNDTSETSFAKVIGEKVERAMDEKGYTIGEVAKCIGISQKDVIHIINGNNRFFSIELLYKFSDLLDVPPMEFAGGLKPVSNIGVNMSVIRKISNVSIERLCNYTGIDVERYKAIEGGSQASFKEIEKFASFYCIPEAFVIGYDFNKCSSRVMSMIRMLAYVNVWNDNMEQGSLTESEIEDVIKYAKFLVAKRTL